MSTDEHEYVNISDGCARCIDCGESWGVTETPPPCPATKRKRLEKYVDRIFYIATTIVALLAWWIMGGK